MTLIKCCKNCTNRKLGCHSVCPAYLLEKKRVDEIREREKREANANAGGKYDRVRKHNKYAINLR